MVNGKKQRKSEGFRFLDAKGKNKKPVSLLQERPVVSKDCRGWQFSAVSYLVLSEQWVSTLRGTRLGRKGLQWKAASSDEAGGRKREKGLPQRRDNESNGGFQKPGFSGGSLIYKTGL